MEPMTKEQVENWRKMFPELMFCPDYMVQTLRDRLQAALGEDTAPTPIPKPVEPPKKKDNGLTHRPFEIL